MLEIVRFIERYYKNNLTFDQDEFLKVIDILINALRIHENPTALNEVLLKIMNRFQNQDFYEVMQIIEYELLMMLEGQ
jgi:hypothetical protein